MADSYVQVPTDGSGKKVDTSELVIGTNTVERERVVLGDPNYGGNLVDVDPYGNIGITESPGSPQLDVLQAILWELRAIRLALVALTCEDGSNSEQDFDPNFLVAERSDEVAT